MIAKHYINYSYPVLKSNDTVENALFLMDDFSVKHLPCLEAGVLSGFISYDILLNYDLNLEIGDIQLLDAQPIILNTDPLLEIIKKSHSSALDILAVEDELGSFIGVIEKFEIYKSFIESLNLYGEGAILEIRIKNNDYSLSNISRIIESESAKIISLFITKNEPNEIILSLKIDINNISAIINALERFDYEVLSYYSSEQVNNLEKDRFDLLMKYLSI